MRRRACREPGRSFDWRSLVLIILVWLGGTGTACAQAAAARMSGQEAATTAEAAREGHLVLFNRPIFTFRATLLGLTPEERARRAAAHLREALAEGADEVTVRTEAEGRVILVGGIPQILITPGDLDPLGRDTLDTAEASTVAALRQVIAETRESRDLRLLATNAALLALVSGLVLLAIRALNWGRRAVVERLVSLAERLLLVFRRESVELHEASKAVLRMERVGTFARRLIDLLFWLLVFVLILEWVGFALRSFPYTRRWGEELETYSLDLAAELGLAIAKAVPKLVVAFLIFALARGLVQVMRAVFDRVERGETTLGWLDRDTVAPTRRITVTVVWIFAVVMAYPYLPGADTDAFKGVSVLLGLMISLGSTSAVSQAACGLILMYARTIRVGEYVRIGEHQGTVTNLGFFTTRVRTDLGEELNLPNAMIVGTATHNFSRNVWGSGCLVDTSVTIGYDVPWRQVEAMLLEAAARTPGLLAAPRPWVLQTGLSDFYPVYRLGCLTSADQTRLRPELLSALHRNIQDVFNEYGVQIMSPSYRGDPATPKVVPPERWYTAPAQPPAEQVEVADKPGPAIR